MPVLEILDNGWILCKGNCITDGAFLSHDLELVDVNKSLSDQELADKYRALRQEASAISRELHFNRGYTFQYKPPSVALWTNVTTNSEPDSFRFIKTETKTVIL